MLTTLLRLYGTFLSGLDVSQGVTPKKILVKIQGCGL
jgi:hypothetical protein